MTVEHTNNLQYTNAIYTYVPANTNQKFFPRNIKSLVCVMDTQAMRRQPFKVRGVYIFHTCYILPQCVCIV
jgi:hypothetical protein